MNFPVLDAHKLKVGCCGWRMTPVAGWWAWKCALCKTVSVLQPIQVRRD